MNKHADISHQFTSKQVKNAYYNYIRTIPKILPVQATSSSSSSSIVLQPFVHPSHQTSYDEDDIIEEGGEPSDEFDEPLNANETSNMIQSSRHERVQTMMSAAPSLLFEQINNVRLVPATSKQEWHYDETDILFRMKKHEMAKIKNSGKKGGLKWDQVLRRFNTMILIIIIISIDLIIVEFFTYNILKFFKFGFLQVQLSRKKKKIRKSQPSHIFKNRENDTKSRKVSQRNK